MSEDKISPVVETKLPDHLKVHSVGPVFFLWPAAIFGAVFGIIGWVLASTDAGNSNPITGYIGLIFLILFLLFFMVTGVDLNVVEIVALLLLGVIAAMIMAFVPEASGQALLDVFVDLKDLLKTTAAMMMQIFISLIMLFGIFFSWLQNRLKPFTFEKGAIEYHDYTGKKRKLSNLQNVEVHIGTQDFLERIFFGVANITIVVQEKDDIFIRSVIRARKKIETIDNMLKM